MKKRLQLSLLPCLVVVMAFSRNTLPQNLQVIAKPDNIELVSATSGIIRPATEFKITPKNVGGNNPCKNFGYADCTKVGPGQTTATEIRLKDHSRVMQKVPQLNIVLKANGTNLVTRDPYRIMIF